LPDELVSKAKQSRSEKKARKAMSKLGKCYSMRQPKLSCGQSGKIWCKGIRIDSAHI